jgi:ABC-type nitrate/sulfonate/bicarbonate transport system substrate-binding protein
VHTVKTRLTALAVAAVALTAGCATSSDRTRSAAAEPAPSTGTPAAELRLGYFPNLTHATAVYGDAAGTFAEALGDTDADDAAVQRRPSAVEALFAGALDATYIGPNPAINAFVKSQGDAVRIVAGATSGGASLVVRPGHRLRRGPRRHAHRHPADRWHAGHRAAPLPRRGGLRGRRQRRRRRHRRRAGEPGDADRLPGR